jgi:hypothetical protein
MHGNMVGIRPKRWTVAAKSRACFVPCVRFRCEIDRSLDDVTLDGKR